MPDQMTTEPDTAGQQVTPVVLPHQIEFFFAKAAENGTKRLSYEGIMAPEEKLRRALADDWEFVGDPWQLCQILRSEIHRLQAERVAAFDEAAKHCDHPEARNHAMRARLAYNAVLEMHKEIAELRMYEQAMQSMAAQFICPRTSGREMAMQQLGLK
ncbi:hypothetical protein LBMAG52_36820 [Planctomycetia bacterium]|nr:hypothetical protein LBMAG52_36820 [Planctomycetia bacterium]